MTIENFNKVLLVFVMSDDLSSRIVTKEECILIYHAWRRLVDDWPFVTKTQRNCFEMYYNMNFSQEKIAKFLGIKQSTVCEHIRKARDSYIKLVEIIYYCILWGIDYGVEKERQKE